MNRGDDPAQAGDKKSAPGRRAILRDKDPRPSTRDRLIEPPAVLSDAQIDALALSPARARLAAMAPRLGARTFAWPSSTNVSAFSPV